MESTFEVDRGRVRRGASYRIEGFRFLTGIEDPIGFRRKLNNVDENIPRLNRLYQRAYLFAEVHESYAYKPIRAPVTHGSFSSYRTLSPFTFHSNPLDKLISSKDLPELQNFGVSSAINSSRRL